MGNKNRRTHHAARSTGAASNGTDLDAALACPCRFPNPCPTCAAVMARVLDVVVSEPREGEVTAA